MYIEGPRQKACLKSRSLFYRIPNYIGIMPNLKQFAIEGNNVKNVRADIIRCGTPRILKHIRQGVESTNFNTSEQLALDTSVNIYPDKYVYFLYV